MAKRCNSEIETNELSRILKLFGGMAILLLVVAFLIGLPDLKRYIRISTM